MKMMDKKYFPTQIKQTVHNEFIYRYRWCVTG